MIADELAEDWAELRNPMEFDFWETEPGKTEKGTDSFNVNVLATSRQWISQVWHDCRRSGNWHPVSTSAWVRWARR